MTAQTSVIEVMWCDIRAELETKRASIHREITAYPSPIPACDAHFNHLLEERAKILEEISFARAAGGVSATHDEAAQRIRNFVASSRYLSDEIRRTLKIANASEPKPL